MSDKIIALCESRDAVAVNMPLVSIPTHSYLVGVTAPDVHIIDGGDTLFVLTDATFVKQRPVQDAAT